MIKNLKIEYFLRKIDYFLKLKHIVVILHLSDFYLVGRSDLNILNDI